VQLHRSGKNVSVKGYGFCHFPPDTVVEGIIVDPEALAKAVKPNLHKLTYGSIDSKRAATGLPAAKIFTRVLQLPPMSSADLEQAVNFEVEQYVPVPVADLYIDYEIINASNGPEGKIDVLMMAAPRAIVDSYIKLFDLLGLEISAVEGNMTSVVRALLNSGDAGGSTLLMDIGSISSDLTIYDRYIPLSGSVPIGGETYTEDLVKTLGIKPDQATEIKVKFGIEKGDMHEKVFAALDPHFREVTKEARRVVKFYEERGAKQQKVGAMVISGGTASMPGIDNYFTREMKLPLKIANPWRNLHLGHNHTVDSIQAPMYATAIGLALRGLK
jgi:type IV pilus assembly protein PilM